MYIFSFDFATNEEYRKGVNGLVFNFSGSAVSWCSKPQPVTAQSTLQAECVEVLFAVGEALWRPRHLWECVRGKKAIHAFVLFGEHEIALQPAYSKIFREKNTYRSKVFPVQGKGRRRVRCIQLRRRWSRTVLEPSLWLCAGAIMWKFRSSFTSGHSYTCSMKVIFNFALTVSMKTAFLKKDVAANLLELSTQKVVSVRFRPVLRIPDRRTILAYGLLKVKQKMEPILIQRIAVPLIPKIVPFIVFVERFVSLLTSSI